jgi:hypothetical protein
VVASGRKMDFRCYCSAAAGRKIGFLLFHVLVQGAGRKSGCQLVHVLAAARKLDFSVVALNHFSIALLAAVTVVLLLDKKSIFSWCMC